MSLPLELLRPGAVSKLRAAFASYEATVGKLHEERLSLQWQLAELQHGTAGGCCLSEVASCCLSEGGDSTAEDNGAEADSGSVPFIRNRTEPRPTSARPSLGSPDLTSSLDISNLGNPTGAGCLAQVDKALGFKQEEGCPAQFSMRHWYHEVDQILMQLEALFFKEMRERLVLSTFVASEVFHPSVTAYYMTAAYPYLIETPMAIRSFLQAVDCSPQMQSRLIRLAPHALIEA